MENIKEKFYLLRHGGLWLAVRGLTTQKKYAKRYSKKEAEATKKHFFKNNYLVEIEEVEEE